MNLAITDKQKNCKAMATRKLNNSKLEKPVWFYT